VRWPSEQIYNNHLGVLCCREKGLNRVKIERLWKECPWRLNRIPARNFLTFHPRCQNDSNVRCHLAYRLCRYWPGEERHIYIEKDYADFVWVCFEELDGFESILSRKNAKTIFPEQERQNRPNASFVISQKDCVFSVRRLDAS
jgi:hypothetical protein